MEINENHCIYYGLGTSSPPVFDNLAIKTQAETDSPTHLQFSMFLSDLDEFGMPRGRPTNQFVYHFWTRLHWGGFLGGPRVAKRHPRAPKWCPKWPQSDHKTANLPPQSCKNEFQIHKQTNIPTRPSRLKWWFVSDTHPSTNRLPRARWRVCRTQFSSPYTHLTIPTTHSA